MKFKISCQTEAEIESGLPPLSVLFGEDPSIAPDYDFHLSEDQFEAFDTFGLAELMEGIFSAREDLTVDKVREFLLSMGYEEVTE